MSLKSLSTASWQKQGHHQDRRCSPGDSFSQGLTLPQTKHAQLPQPHRSCASGHHNQLRSLAPPTAFSCQPSCAGRPKEDTASASLIVQVCVRVLPLNTEGNNQGVRYFVMERLIWSRLEDRNNKNVFLLFCFPAQLLRISSA